MQIFQKSKHSIQKLCRYAVILLVIVGITIWGCLSPAVSSAEDQYVLQCYHSGWSQQLGDETIVLDDLQDYIPVDAGESLIFTCTLPEITDDHVFLFYSENKEVRCYVDGVTVQNFTMQDGYSFLNTPGSAWNQVDLDSSMSGKTVTLVFTSPLGRYDSLCNIYLISNQYVNTVRLNYFWGLGFASILVFIAMIITTLSIFVTRQRPRKMYLLSLVQYFFVTLAWLLAELNAYDLIFAKPIVSYLLGELFWRLIPLALLYVFKYSTPQLWNPKLFRIICGIAWGNFLIPFVLQFAFGISLLELTVVYDIVCALVDMVILVVLTQKLLHFKSLQYTEYPSLAIIILIVFKTVDTIALNNGSQYNPFIGIWTGLGTFLFFAATLIILAYITSKIEIEKVQYEQSYHELENSALVRQLEAHFIFNVLNSISADCKTDPVAADRTVVTFSSYLRSYLHLIRTGKNIPFQEELELVEDYLALQKMRFGDSLTFSIETEYIDFEVPPFSVYTLVENSIIHGIPRTKQGGTLTISTKKNADSIQLIIADDGAGFDTTKPAKSTSIGLSNTKKRFEIMANATCSIDSCIGAGTTVTVTIPTPDAEETPN